jgi:hypothetical protein
MKPWIKALSFLTLMLSGTAIAFVDQITASPAQPNSNQPITISFRAGDCDGITLPVTWELQGQGSMRDLVVHGLPMLDILFCFINPHTTAINIGTLPPGDYEINIKIVDPNDGFGGIPTSSYGNVVFSVGGAPRAAIPALQPLGLIMFLAAVMGVACWRLRREYAAFSWLAVMVLPVLMMPAASCLAAEVFALEVTLIPPPSGPSPESVVEGYDFSSGQSPPFAAISAGSPSHATYLLPARATGSFSALLQAHPDSVRAQLERTVLIVYSSLASRDVGQAALQSESVIESVNVPIDYEFSADVAARLGVAAPIAKTVSGVPDWRSQLNLPQAWQHQGGWARIGVLDNGYDWGHPDLIAFDGAARRRARR